MVLGFHHYARSLAKVAETAEITKTAPQTQLKSRRKAREKVAETAKTQNSFPNPARKPEKTREK